MLALAEAAGPSFARPTSAHGSTGCAREQENLRAALRWAIDGGDAAIGLRTAGAIWDYWHYWAELREGVRWLDALLALPAAGRAEPRAGQGAAGARRPPVLAG